MTDDLMNQATELQDHHRDGASQADRRLAALDPEYVAVDERSLRDLLAFARAYGQELNYYDVEHFDIKAMGDWSRFVDPALDLEDLAALIADPDSASGSVRPHLALFLTFLHLLGHARGQLNGLTRRHLDFYYRQILRMTKRPGQPDRVNVWVELAPDTGQFLLPAGTLLNAGADSLGQDLNYRTERDIVVNRAQVAQLSSLYADKRVIGIREAREAHDGPKNEAFVRMVQIALGHPFPGDSLPAYPTGIPFAQARERALSLLEALEISSKAGEPVQHLSGGEQQRTAIARALINDPTYIIADEPTAHLDTELAGQFMSIGARLKSEGRTILMGSHDPVLIEAPVVDRVVEMRYGCVVRQRGAPC